jgi:hypothetical protein
MQGVRENNRHGQQNKADGIEKEIRRENLEKHKMTPLNNTGKARSKRLKVSKSFVNIPKLPTFRPSSVKNT